MVVNCLTKQDVINRNYNHIYAHEMAHKTAGGVYAGAISIERNAQGIPVSGHVPIQMPTLDKNNPQKTIEHANTVIRAALAPSDPSAQDYKVAAKAQQIKMQAQAFKAKHQGNKLDIQG
ncbi:MAG: putative metalloprotease CJM1_0395 family protein [Candidatus Gastranaerophilaceae bacterium]